MEKRKFGRMQDPSLDASQDKDEDAGELRMKAMLAGKEQYKSRVRSSQRRRAAGTQSLLLALCRAAGSCCARKRRAVTQSRHPS